MKAPFADELKADFERLLAHWCDECLGTGQIAYIDLFNVKGEKNKGRQYRPCEKCQIKDG